MMWNGDFGNDIYNNGKTLVCHGISPVNQTNEMKNRFRAEDVTLVTLQVKRFLTSKHQYQCSRAVFGDPNGNMNKASTIC
jgi:hypothetical protein